jgi:hypothetical protein
LLVTSQEDRIQPDVPKHWEVVVLAERCEKLTGIAFRFLQVGRLVLAHSAVVHADETSWSINSVWAFLSEKARVLLFGVHKDAETLKQILDATTFAGILISDDAAVYRHFNRSQKCWAHLLRKAIRLTLLWPDSSVYRRSGERLPFAVQRIDRANKAASGARRQTVLTSVLESLRQYLPDFTLGRVVEEVQRWAACGCGCFEELLRKLNLKCPQKSILDALLPVPSD